MGLIRSILVGYETPYAPTSPPPPPPPPPNVPAAPTSLALTSRTATSATFSFTDNANNEDGFRIYAGGQLKGTAAANASAITASGLSEGTQYSFVCKAFNANGESSGSNTVSAYTRLATPTGFQGQQFSTFVRFTWNDNSSKESEYALQKDGSDFSVLSANTEQADVANASSTGSWRVVARASGIPDSANSNAVAGPPYPE